MVLNVLTIIEYAAFCFLILVTLKFSFAFQLSSTRRLYHQQRHWRHPLLATVENSYSLHSEEFWIENIFSKLFVQPPPLDDGTSIYEDYVIMNAPHVTLKHPLISVNISEIVHMILSRRDEPDSRFKPMYAIVTGLGRGKTRVLFELDKALKQDKSIISSTITFNHKTAKISTDLSHRELNYALAIVSRVLSTHYKIPFALVDTTLQAAFQQVPSIGAADSPFIIRACVRHVVRQMRLASNDIDRFILQVDESKKIEDVLGKRIHDTLRAPLLDTQIMAKHERPVLVDLVMSALDVASTGVSDSSRPIIAIPTPVSLDAVEVLDKWISPSLPSLQLSTPAQRLKMLSLIACLSAIPRAIQLLVKALSEMEMGIYTIETSPRVSITLTSQEINKLYSRTVSLFEEFYGITHIGSLSPSPHQMKALLFDELTPVDDDLMMLIKSSVLTNSIDDLKPESFVIPRTSILSVQVMSRTSNNSYVKPLHSTIYSLLAYLGSPKFDTGTENSGKPLEIIMRGLMDARLRVLDDIASQTKLSQYVTISKLLRIDSVGSYEEEDLEYYDYEDNGPRRYKQTFSAKLGRTLFKKDIHIDHKLYIMTESLVKSNSDDDQGNYNTILFILVDVTDMRFFPYYSCRATAFFHRCKSHSNN